MIYPCKDCVVDTMCVEICDKLIFYLDSLVGQHGKYIPKELILTHIRVRRALYCINHFQKDVRLFCAFKETARELHDVNFFNIPNYFF